MKAGSLAPILVALLGGCAHMPQPLDHPLVQYHIDRDYHSYGIRRVAVMPFQDCELHPGGTVVLAGAFLEELHRGHGFEPVPIDAETLEELGPIAHRREGAYSLEALRKIRKRLRADALFLGAVTSYRPYEPVVVGAQVELVSLETGQTVWMADGLIDTAEGAVVRLLREDDAYRGSGMDHEWGLKIRSPRHVARYLAAISLRTLP